MNIRSSLTLEFVAQASGDLMVVISRPGREGTLTRVWRAAPGCGRLSITQLEDVRSWVAQTMAEWLLLCSGVQEALPGF